MADPDRVARIRAYLEQHRNTYDRDALRQQLLADGYADRDIDLAMTQVYGNDVEASMSSSRAVLTLPLVILGTVLLNSGACFASLRTVGIVPIGIGVVLELIAAALLWNRQPTVARGIIWGVPIWLILTIALVFFVLSQLG